MFGRKQIISSPPGADAPQLVVHTIPTDFYGGANPVVQFTDVPHSVPKPGTPTALEKRSFNQATALGAHDQLHPVNLLTNRKFLLLAGGGVFVVALIGSAVYYVFNASRVAPAPAPQTPNVAAVTPSSEPVIETTSSTPVTATTTESITLPGALQETTLEFPPSIIGDGTDGDSDALSDQEEILFSTDPAVPDSDADKYIDGHEVFNLYNPAGKEPMKLADSGLVREFTNQVFGYRLLYPSSWQMGAVQNDGAQLLFNSSGGEYVELRVFDRDPNQSFADWFAVHAPAENFNALVAFDSVFKQRGWRRTDYLVYFFDTPTRMYSLIYHPVPQASLINYRSVIKLMARSFNLENAPAVVPDRIIEDAPPIIEVSSTISEQPPSTTGTSATSSSEL